MRRSILSLGLVVALLAPMLPGRAAAQEKPIDVLALTAETLTPRRIPGEPTVERSFAENPFAPPRLKDIRLSSGATAAIIVGAICVTVLIIVGVVVLGKGPSHPHAPSPPKP